MNAIKAQHPLIAEVTAKLFKIIDASINKHEPLEVDRLMQNVILDIIGSVIFGDNFGALDGKTVALMEETDKALVESQKYRRNYFNYFKSTESAKKKFGALRSNMLQLVKSYIDRRRSDPKRHEKTDILNLILNAQDEQSGHQMTEDELQSQLRVLLVAGFETTAHSLAFFLYNSCIHGDETSKLQKEADSILGKNLIPSPEQLADLKLLHCFINESMRIFPIAGTSSVRELENDIEISGFRIPAGVELLANIFSVHNNPKYWDNPNEFKPERFTQPTPAFMPFTVGPRNCIGQTLAIYEIKVIGCAILKNYNLKLAPNQNIELTISTTLRPKHGIKILFEKRQQ